MNFQEKIIYHKKEIEKLNFLAEKSKKFHVQRNYNKFKENAKVLSEIFRVIYSIEMFNNVKIPFSYTHFEVMIDFVTFDFLNNIEDALEYAYSIERGIKNGRN